MAQWSAALAAAACWAVAAGPAALGETGADGGVIENVVVFEEGGGSSLMTYSAGSVEMFSQSVDLPETGGVLRRERVWADRQTLRVTSLDGAGLVFLGNERVGAFTLDGHADGDELFVFREHGHTLRITQEAALDQEESRGIRVRARITRP